MDPMPPQSTPPVITPESPSLDQPQSPPNSIEAKAFIESHKPKHHIPILAILIAALITILLVGIAAFVYIQSKQNAKPSNTTDQSTATQPKNRVLPDDIGKVSRAIDTNFNNINDSADFTNDDLSNQTLGL